MANELTAALWARQRILDDISGHGKGTKSEALFLASNLHLVTPISSAIVHDPNPAMNEEVIATETTALPDNPVGQVTSVINNLSSAITGGVGAAYNALTSPFRITGGR